MKLLPLILQAAAWSSTTFAFQDGCGITFPMGNYTRHHKRSTELVPRGATKIAPGDSDPRRFQWPRSKSTKLVNIPYCYDDDYVRDHFKEKVDKAIKAWYDALGGPPSEESGHGISFKERQNGCGEPLYCNDGIGEWNFDIKFKTIAIINDERAAPAANVGYRHSEPPQAWDMIFNVVNSLDDEGFVHELGHVIGFIHEHQRPDRDDHVVFRCEKLDDFERVWQRVQAEDPSITKDQLCYNDEIATRFGFSANQFMKYPVRENALEAWSGDSAYDISSIMHYPSIGFGLPPCKAGNMDECPLLKKTEGGETVGIPVQTLPSQGDVAFVKKLYPFVKPPAAMRFRRSARVDVDLD